MTEYGDRLLCNFKLPRYLKVVEDQRWRQVWPDDGCDFYKQ